MKLKLYYYFDTSTCTPEKQIEISSFEHCKKYSPELVFIQALIVDVPDVDVPSRAFIVKEMVSTLEAENKELLATAHMKIQANKNKINSLLCLENKEPA